MDVTLTWVGVAFFVFVEVLGFKCVLISGAEVTGWGKVL